MKHIIAPAARECGYDAIRADQISEPGLKSSTLLSPCGRQPRPKQSSSQEMESFNMVRKRDTTEERHRFLRLGPMSILLLVVLSAGLLTANVLLVQQNTELKVEVARKQKAREIPVGAALPPLNGIDVDGRTVEISFEDESRKTLFLVFSTTCGWCGESMPGWKALISHLAPDSYRIVGLAARSDGVDDYVRKHGLKIPIISQVDFDDIRAYRIGKTPQTILVDPRGTVEAVWTGALLGDIAVEIEDKFNITLPVIE